MAAMGMLVTIALLDLASASLTDVYAQSPSSNSATGNFTLSGESLRKVNNLSIKDDYRNFFLRTANQTNILDVENFNYLNQDDGIWEISDRLEIQVNVPLSRSIYPFPSPPRQNGSIFVDNLNRFELQYQLLEEY
jgi:hypothetical protein